MPTPEQIKTARKELGLSTEDAAALLEKSSRTWQAWEYGRNKMSAADWELFKIKTKRKEKKK
jgi:DNA-binding transcriptional regulator YiaG